MRAAFLIIVLVYLLTLSALAFGADSATTGHASATVSSTAALVTKRDGSVEVQSEEKPHVVTVCDEEGRCETLYVYE